MSRSEHYRKRERSPERSSYRDNVRNSGGYSATTAGVTQVYVVPCPFDPSHQVRADEFVAHIAQFHPSVPLVDVPNATVVSSSRYDEPRGNQRMSEVPPAFVESGAAPGSGFSDAGVPNRQNFVSTLYLQCPLDVDSPYIRTVKDALAPYSTLVDVRSIKSKNCFFALFEDHMAALRAYNALHDDGLYLGRGLTLKVQWAKPKQGELVPDATNVGPPPAHRSSEVAGSYGHQVVAPAAASPPPPPPPPPQVQPSQQLQPGQQFLTTIHLQCPPNTDSPWLRLVQEALAPFSTTVDVRSIKSKSCFFAYFHDPQAAWTAYEALHDRGLPLSNMTLRVNWAKAKQGEVIMTGPPAAMPPPSNTDHQTASPGLVPSATGMPMPHNNFLPSTASNTTTYVPPTNPIPVVDNNVAPPSMPVVPTPSSDPSLAVTGSCVSLTNVPSHVTDQHIFLRFLPFASTSIVRIGPSFALVHFQTPTEAAESVRAVVGKQLEGIPIRGGDATSGCIGCSVLR